MWNERSLRDQILIINMFCVYLINNNVNEYNGWGGLQMEKNHFSAGRHQKH